MSAVGLRLQSLALADQIVALARLAMGRTETGRFAPGTIDLLFDEVGLRRPARTSNALLAGEGHTFSRIRGRGLVWTLTPAGRARSEALLSDLDATALLAEAARSGAARLAGATHMVIPPSFAAPEMLPALRTFLEVHPFETNVFGMTRFPDRDNEDPDPVAPMLAVARETCARHGLEFHLASDRAIHPDLWPNVAAHMWASNYGIAFFENRRGRGLNYNLTIEVGAMLVTGRRTALLKDTSIESMPTDLVGKIYKSIDLDNADSVARAIHSWIRDDLGLSSCGDCPPIATQSAVG
jgi:hypothetical protein